MDIIKLKNLQDKLNDESVKELLENVPFTFLQFMNSKTVRYNLFDVKTGRKLNQSARIINNWIKQDVLSVDEKDMGKVNRFNRIESIWLNIVIEARKFGFPLDGLKQARKELFFEPVHNFSTLKFSILDSILREPSILIITEGGGTNIMSLTSYSKWVATGLLQTHLSFNLSEFIRPEYPVNMLGTDFNIMSPYEDINKCKLLYYLKTGDYQSLKIHITPEDVRFIDSSKLLLNNSELMNVLKIWKFDKIVVNVNQEVDDLILN